MSRRRIALALAGLALFVALVLVWPVVSLALDEGAVPSASDAALPPGVTIAHEELRCGSGGCYRELRLTAPRDQSPTEVAASLGLPGETCRPRSLLDRRRVCTGGDLHGKTVVLYVRYDRSFYL